MAVPAPIPVKRQPVNSGELPTARAGEIDAAAEGAVARQAHRPWRAEHAEVRGDAGWYREMLGFVCSDDVYAGEKDHLIGSFNRLDRGDDFVDHHVFFCLRREKTGLNHLSFEVPDIDDVAMGHDYLKIGYEHMWGIGRHCARQPGLRLLGRSVGPRARALGRQRPAQRAQWLQPGTGRRSAGFAMGRAAARKAVQ